MKLFLPPRQRGSARCPSANQQHNQHEPAMPPLQRHRASRISLGTSLKLPWPYRSSAAPPLCFHTRLIPQSGLCPASPPPSPERWRSSCPPSYRVGSKWNSTIPVDSSVLASKCHFLTASMAATANTG